MCLKIRICKYVCSNLTNMSNFQPLEVVGRGSETQLQVAENLSKSTGLNEFDYQKGYQMRIIFFHPYILSSSGSYFTK